MKDQPPLTPLQVICILEEQGSAAALDIAKATKHPLAEVFRVLFKLEDEHRITSSWVKDDWGLFECGNGKNNYKLYRIS